MSKNFGEFLGSENASYENLKYETDGSRFHIDANFLISWHETYTGKKSLADRLDLAASKSEHTQSKDAPISIGVDAPIGFKQIEEAQKNVQAAFGVISKMTQQDYSNALNKAKKVHAIQDPKIIDVDKPNRFPAKIEDFQKIFIKNAINQGYTLDCESAGKKRNLSGSINALIKTTLRQIKETPKKAIQQIGQDLRKGFNSILSR